MGNEAESIDNFNKALGVIKASRYFLFESACYEGIADCYEKLNKMDSAYKYHSLFKIASDSLLNTENIKSLTRAESKFQLSSKQNEIDLLNEKNKNNELIVAREKTIKWAFLGGLVLMVIILFLVFRQLKIKKAAFTKINEQKHIIEEKNKEIMDSIRYARRIQNALMASERQIENVITRLRKTV